MLSIQFDLGLSDLDKFFEVVDLLEDREGLTDKFRPEVEKFLSREKYFKPGIQKKAHGDSFPKLITSLIRKELSDTLKLSPEEILLLTDESFLDMLTEGYYFNPNNYVKGEIVND